VIGLVVYHGSNIIVEKPEIRESERFLDFGMGFYTTSNREQAEKWSFRAAKRSEPQTRILSLYEFDLENAARELSVIQFNEPNGEWLDFVCLCRMGREASKVYDIAIGAVANDTVYKVVQFYENGVYDKDEAIKRLKIQKLFNQILFHTEKALNYCKFKGFEDLGGVK